MKNALISCALCVALVLLSLSSATGLVFNVPKAKGVGSDPIRYSFKLNGGERISFFFESRNATVTAEFVEISSEDLSVINQTRVNATSMAYEKSYPHAWRLNITINATVEYTGVGIDFYAKYTYMRTSGFVLSISVGIASAVIGILCISLLMNKRKTGENA